MPVYAPWNQGEPPSVLADDHVPSDRPRDGVAIAGERDEWLLAKHPAWFVIEVIDGLDV